MGKRVVVALFVLAASTGTAQAETTCFTDFGHCMERASTVDSFWYRWAAGLDCELQLINCTRQMLVGA